MLFAAMHTSLESDGSKAANPAQSLTERCQMFLDKVIEQTPSISMTCLGTADGRLFAAQTGATGGQRFAAMTSSLIALSESFAKEALRSQCTYSLVATPHGVVICVRVPSKRGHYVLSVGADATESMALVLRRALDSSDALAAIIDTAV